MRLLAIIAKPGGNVNPAVFGGSMNWLYSIGLVEAQWVTAATHRLQGQLQARSARSLALYGAQYIS